MPIPIYAWIIIGAVVLFLIYCFNRIIQLENRIDNSWAQIDVQLKRRSDLVPNLIETVKGYAKHEKSIMTEVTKARENMLKANTPADKVKAGNMLEGALKSIFALAENYPQLRANENFKLLQEELSGIESKIAFSRQHYNDTINEYNNTIESFPSMIVARTMGRKQEKQMLQITEAERKNVKVEF